MVYFTTSWDDGNKSDIKIAALLKEYGLKGTFYIPIKWRMRTLTDGKIKAISKNFEIGSHGLEHKRLTSLTEKGIETELVSSKDILQKIIRKPVTSYAYPFGKFSKKSPFYVKKAGYRFARTSQEFSTISSNQFLSKITLRAENNFSKLLHPMFLPQVVESRFKWNNLAKLMFNNCSKSKFSVFHLIGHSYNIGNGNFEYELIDFFDYLKKFDFIPVTNSQITRLWKE